MEVRPPHTCSHTHLHTHVILIKQKSLLDKSDCSDEVEFGVYSQEYHERDACRTRRRNTLWRLLTRFVFRPSSPYPATGNWPCFLPPQASHSNQMWFISSELSQGNWNENYRHHCTPPHPFHPLMWVVLPLLDGPNAPLNLSPRQNPSGPKQQESGPFVFRLQPGRVMRVLLRHYHSHSLAAKAPCCSCLSVSLKSVRRCPPNNHTAHDEALHESLIHPLICPTGFNTLTH